MRYHLDKNCGKSAYLQLYEQLRTDIVGGVYACGDKLPSKRLLAEEVDVSVITVEHAYAILEDEGYLQSRQRRGYFVTFRDKENLPSAPLPSARHVHSLQSTASEFPFSVLAKTMRRVLSDYAEEIMVKSPNWGCMALREQISAYLARSNGMRVAPSQILVGSGAEYLYTMLAQLWGKQHVFAIEEPSYEKIRRVYEAGGVCYEALPLTSNGIDSAALEQSRASVLHVTPFHSYPSGISADASKRQEYLRWAEKREGFVIEDNYDSELTVSKKHEDTLFSHSGRVLYLNTFSRTIAPSLRVGYLVLPEALLEEFVERLGFYSCTVPVFEQYVLTELLRNGDFERHIHRIRRKRRKLVI